MRPLGRDLNSLDFRLILLPLSGLAILSLAVLYAQAADTKRGNWPVYGGDSGGMKYSPLEQVNRSNVEQLQEVWQWRTGEGPIPGKGTIPGKFEATPLMIDDVLYVSTPYNRVVALDANSGKEIWSYDPHSYDGGQPPGNHPFDHRGVAAWTDGKQRRIFIHTHWRLIGLDAQTGEPIPEFGNHGVVDLTEALGWKGNKSHYGNSSPPVVVKNLVIVGNAVFDRFIYRDAPPGDVLAFDTKNGKLVWRFRTIPRRGEFGYKTWEGEFWQLGGHVNVWPPFVADEERGLLYLPVTTPSNDFYGGNRKGNNLFGDSLVCLDATTGNRVWHFQTVHHGLWDYDGIMAPSLATIHVNGKKIDAVAAPSKQGFLYVFDRVTGKPVWPIEERPVPQSDVPGERTSPTQPFPTKPPPFSKQGFTLDDVVDFTPEIKAMASERLKPFRYGPIFTPPSIQGTIQMPGAEGGSSWGGAAIDPESEILYIRASNQPSVSQVIKRNESEIAQWMNYSEAPTGGETYTTNSGLSVTVAGGIPINKPPYGVVTAIDLGKGEQVWQKPLGDMPALRSHPLLKALNLPELGSYGHSGLMVTGGGLVFVSGGNPYLYALDKKDGILLWKGDLRERSEATPMTYRTQSGRQFVVVATGFGKNASLVAFALPTH